MIPISPRSDRPALVPACAFDARLAGADARARRGESEGAAALLDEALAAVPSLSPFALLEAGALALALGRPAVAQALRARLSSDLHLAFDLRTLPERWLALLADVPPGGAYSVLRPEADRLTGALLAGLRAARPARVAAAERDAALFTAALAELLDRDPSLLPTLRLFAGALEPHAGAPARAPDPLGLSFARAAARSS